MEPLKNTGAAVSVSVSMNNSINPEMLRHYRVEELRKMAIDKLNISEDNVKKMKKAKLIEKLSQ
jgi:hypothetical protein